MNKFEKLRDEGFVVREREIAGKKCYLVFPSKLGITWTKDNIIYRSSIWTEDGQPVSLGFKKFFNFGEANDVCPDFVEKDLKDNVALVIEKIDGSCLIVSSFEGELIVRTRGTFDAYEHEKTREDLALLKARYPRVFDVKCLEPNVSYIYEWTTRNNRIVVDYGEAPDIKLIGVIDHWSYSYVPQVCLPEIALGELHVRTAAYHRVRSFDELNKKLADMEQAEGYCVYFNNGQDIKKVKCSWYLERHRLRGNCNLTFMLDLFERDNFPSSEEFLITLKSFIDFECMPDAESIAAALLDHYATAKGKEASILAAVQPYKEDSSKEGRKEAAKAIIAAYGSDAGLAFTLLDSGQLESRQIKKMILTQIKNVC